MQRAAISTLISCFIGTIVSVIPVFVIGSSVLLPAIASDTGWSRGQTSSLIGTALFTIAVATMLVGRLIDRIGHRKVILFSNLAFGVSLLLFSFAPTFPVALALAALVGLFGTGASQFAYVTVLPLWFDRRLVLSVGIAMMGIGVGSMALPVVIGSLSTSLDWRSVYQALAALVIVVGFPNAFFLLRVPARPIATSGGAQEKASELPGVSVGEALRMRVFWQMGASFFLATTAIAGLGVHLVSLLVDRGFTQLEAASIFSIWGAAVAIARLSGGVLLDYIDARVIGGALLTCAVVGVMMLARSGSMPVAMVAVLLFASAHGFEGDIVPYLTRRYFGLRAYGATFGILGFLFGLGPALGSILIGAGVDRYGSYQPILWIVAATTACAALLLVTIGRPRAFDAPEGDERADPSSSFTARFEGSLDVPRP